MIRSLERTELGISNPVVFAAAEAVTRQRRKEPYLLIDRRVREGIHMLPRWDGYSLERIAQGLDDKGLYPRGSSVHEVSFAAAEVRVPDGQICKIDVAIKPYDKPLKAIYEARVNSEVLNRGFSTTDPIGVVVDSNRAFIVTPVKPNVQTIDTEPWHQFFLGSEKIKNHFKSRLEKIGRTLALLNLSGIEQGDVQLRNYWVTHDGRVEAFDWESSKVVPLPIQPEDLLNISREDLLRFLKILDSGPNILTGPETSRFQQFTMYVFDPYYDTMETAALERGLPDTILSTISTIRKTFKTEHFSSL